MTHTDPARTGPAAAVLVLEDGRTFTGQAYGAIGTTVGEAVFSTGMSGYQETLTDPSYHRQVVVMTAPHIGNTGVNDEDPESGRIWVAGYVVRDPARRASNWRATRSLDEELERYGVVGHQRRRHPGPDPAPARARGDARRDLLRRGCRAGVRHDACRGDGQPADGRCGPHRGGHHGRGVRRGGASAIRWPPSWPSTSGSRP